MKLTLAFASLVVAFALGATSVRAADSASPSPTPSTATSLPAADATTMGRAKDWLHRFQTGDVDRSQLTAQMNSSLTPAIVTQASAQLGPLGDPTSFTFVGSKAIANDSTVYVYRVVFKAITLDENFTLDKSGKIDGLFLRPAN